MKSVVVIFLVLFVVLAANAKRVLIVSDIEDTLKVSHVLNTSGKVGRAFDVTTSFTGMAQLYQLMLNENAQDTRFVYLSNAPKKIAGVPALDLSLRTFLSFNNFPPGEVKLRESIFDPNHKINEIRRMIEVERPDVLILIGDNGERDPEVYHQAYMEFSNQVRILTFIHQMYSHHVPFHKLNFLAEVGTSIEKEQVGFVTPIEIAVELHKQNLLSENSYTWMIKNVMPYIIKEGRFKRDGFKPISFPAFKNCSDFVWRWEITPELSPIYDKIKKVCR